MGLNILAWVKAKKYTDNAVSQTAGLHREIVNSLPIIGDDKVIYMVPVTGSGDDNYNEYMWINGAYELIGNTRVDLTDYYNKTQVDSALNGSIKDVYKVLGQNGAKNLLDVGSEIHTVSISGVDIMFGIYGDITLDGTAQDDIVYVLDTDLGPRLNAFEHYIASAGKTMDGSMLTYYLSIQEVHEGGTTSSLADVTNDEVEFSKGSVQNIRCVLIIKAGTRLNWVSIDPMVRHASDTDDTHRPYAKTNKEITDLIGDITQTGLTGDSVAEQLETVGDQIIGLQASKLTLVESKVTLSGDSLTFDTTLQNDTMYLVAMSSPVSAASRRMRCSMIRTVNTTTNEIYFGSPDFTVSVSALKLSINCSEVTHGIRATLIKLM